MEERDGGQGRGEDAGARRAVMRTAAMSTPARRGKAAWIVEVSDVRVVARGSAGQARRQCEGTSEWWWGWWSAVRGSSGRRAMADRGGWSIDLSSATQRLRLLKTPPQCGLQCTPSIASSHTATSQRCIHVDSDFLRDLRSHCSDCSVAVHSISVEVLIPH